MHLYYIVLIVILIILLIFISLRYIMVIKSPEYKFMESHSVKGVLEDVGKPHVAKALVLTCIDFRLLSEYVRFLSTIGYNDNFDDFILAGASLGFNQSVFPDWKSTFLEHLRLAQDLHHIKEIIVIDHMDCGAYKEFYNKPNISDQEERALHIENLRKFRKYINENYKTLDVHCYLMDLDGTTKEIK